VRAWGRKARLCDTTWEAPVLAQVACIKLDDVTMASVVAALGSNQQPVAIDRARIDRQIRELARHGLALALPEKVEMARPTGVGRALTAYDMPIEGRDEWLAAARRLA